jgi:hypothetical protein
MPAPTPDACVEAISREQIECLARLYDRFAHALDPFSGERDQAERAFRQEVANRYDLLAPPKPEFHVFQKGVILRRRRHLRASDKPASV